MIHELAGTRLRILLSALTTAMLVHFAYGFFAAVSAAPPLVEPCTTWDYQTSIGIALLVPDHTERAEARIDEALFRVRRARKHCRAGLLDLARQDYEALQRAHPFPAGADHQRSAASRQQSDRFAEW